jgi:hypothetical protein
MAAARSPEELSFDPSGAYRERRLHVGRMRQQEGRIREEGKGRDKRVGAAEATEYDNRRECNRRRNGRRQQWWQ